MGELAFPAWDPVFLDLPGPLDLRYYGLMYVVGFVCGHFILTRLARSGFLPLAEEKVGDLIFALVLGVVLGGRIGYTLFYKPEILSQPLELFKIWQGGLSFHGGLLGVITALILFSRKHGLPTWRVGDCLALATCPGIFAVRMANFINGELYGRIIPEDQADQALMAMRFPTDPVARQLLGIRGVQREAELAIQQAYADGSWDKIKDRVPLRHPSQLYEGVAEGLFLGLFLWLVYVVTKKRQLGTGTFMGLFLGGYGLMRYFIEFYRQPDDIDGLIILDQTRGQQLCILMMLAGLLVLAFRFNKLLPSTPRPEGGAETQA